MEGFSGTSFIAKIFRMHTGGFTDPATGGGGRKTTAREHPGRHGGLIAAGTRPRRQRGVVAVGGLVQRIRVDCCHALEHRPAPASMTCRWPTLRA